MFNQEKVNQLYPEAHIYEAMEIWSLPKTKKGELKRVCDSGEYFAQLKIDGNWYEFNKSPLGKSYLFSRGVSVKTDLPTEGIEKTPHIEKLMCNIPNDTIIIGEIHVPGKTTNEVRSIMGCLPKKAIARQEKEGYVHFYIYDILRFEGRDVSQLGAYERYLMLKQVYDEFIPSSDLIELADTIEENIYDQIAIWLAEGHEGAVLKKKTAPYTEDSRPAWATIKVKKEDTVDLICIGFDDPTMEYTGSEIETWEYWAILEATQFDGWTVYEKFKGPRKDIRSPKFQTIPITKPFYLGHKTAIRLGVYKEDKLIQVGTVSSGLTDQMRESISKEPEKYLNTVVECKCMEITKDSLRHPIFIRFRDDKKPESCTFKNIFS